MWTQSCGIYWLVLGSPSVHFLYVAVTVIQHVGGWTSLIPTISPFSNLENTSIMKKHIISEENNSSSQNTHLITVLAYHRFFMLNFQYLFSFETTCCLHLLITINFRKKWKKSDLVQSYWLSMNHSRYISSSFPDVTDYHFYDLLRFVNKNQPLNLGKLRRKTKNTFFFNRIINIIFISSSIHLVHTFIVI